MPISTVGGKAARLEMLESIVRVKPFIKIDAREVSFAVRTRRMTGSARRRLARLPAYKLYAVRSSAEGEDSSSNAWAGQFKTVLNVPHAELEKAIIECGDAVNSENVAAYAATHKVKIGKLEIMVQEMVDAEYAGVLFTRNPVGSEDHMVIEAVRGNAEKLVSGHVEPTRYYVDAKTRAVVKVEIANGVALSEYQINELLDAATTVRGIFREEQDIEWAFEKMTGYLFINQARPITRLEEVLDDAAMAAGNLRAHLVLESARLSDLGCMLGSDVLSNQNIAELLTSHPTKMAHGLFCHLFARGEGAIKTGRNAMGYEIGEELEEGFQLLVAGKPMMSVIHDAFTYRIRGIPLPDYCRIVNGYLKRIASDESLANYPEVALYDQDPSREFLGGLFGPEKGAYYHTTYDLFFERLRILERSTEECCLGEFLPRWQQTIDELSLPNMPMDKIDIIAEAFKGWCERLRTDACPMFVTVARLGFFAFARVRAKLQLRFGKELGEQYLNTLLAVLPPESPNYRFSAVLVGVRNGLASIEEAVAEFGHLGEHELEISTPRYSEQPDLLQMLASKATSPTDLATENARKATEVEVALEAIMDGEWEELKYDINVARRYLMLREVVKFNYLKGYAIVRRLALGLERALGWESGLIFHLDPIDVFRLPYKGAELHDIAILARDEWNANRSIHVPSVIYADKLEVIGRAVSTGGTTLHGVGVTSKVHEGECVVVTSLSETSLLALLGPGSILVTENTDPGWAPVIAVLGERGGLVTEIGGLLAHTAICAREQGISAVLNVPNATTILKTGMRVRVDGRAGVVEILSPD